jgi:hypothetical protein
MGPGVDNPKRRNEARRLALTEIGIAKLEMIDEAAYKLNKILSYRHISCKNRNFNKL